MTRRPAGKAFGAGWALLFVAFTGAAALLWTGIGETPLGRLPHSIAKWVWLGAILVAAFVLPLLTPKPKDSSRLRAFQVASLLILTLALAGAVALRPTALPQTARSGVRIALALFQDAAIPVLPPAPTPTPAPVPVVVTEPPAAPAALITRSVWGSVDVRPAEKFADGSVVISGTFNETAQFGSGPEAQLKVATGLTDGFVAVFSAEKKLRWVRLLRTCSSSAVEARAGVDGSVLVAARIGVPTSIETGSGENLKIPLASKTDHPSYLLTARYEADGRLGWAKWFSTESGMQGFTGDEALEGGDSLVWLTFSKYLREGPEESDLPLTSKGNIFNGIKRYEPAVALFRYRKDGSLLWRRTLQSPEPMVARDFARAGAGFAFIGTVSPLESATPSPDAMVVAWVSATGDTEQLRFVRSAAPPPSPDPNQVIQLRPSTVSPSQIAAGDDGSIVISGSFMGEIRVDGTTPLTSAGNTDLVLMAFAPDRKLRWAHASGGKEHDFSIAQDLQLRGDSVELAGSVENPLELAHGTPSARALKPGDPISFRAMFGPDGAVRSVDRIAQFSLRPEVGCCTRTSLQTERTDPPRAAPAVSVPREVSAWLDDVLPKDVVLGRTKENDVAFPGVQRVPTISNRDWLWPLAPAALPGGATKGTRLLESSRGVAYFVLLRPPEGTQGDALETVRKFLAPLERGTVNQRRSHSVVDHYCNLPGRPGVGMHLSYREGRLTEVMFLGERAPLDTAFQPPPQCFSPEEAKKWDALDQTLSGQ